MKTVYDTITNPTKPPYIGFSALHEIQDKPQWLSEYVSAIRSSTVFKMNVNFQEISARYPVTIDYLSEARPDGRYHDTFMKNKWMEPPQRVLHSGEIHELAAPYEYMWFEIKDYEVVNEPVQTNSAPDGR
jgi:hypothetical protein